MVYKDTPRYRVRPVDDVKEDLLEANRVHGPHVPTLFIPAGNTIAMKTEDLAEICRFAKATFPKLKRITVYGSSQFIHKKGLRQLEQLAKAGLGRIHVGLESGDDIILKKIRKGTNAEKQIEAGRWARAAGIELSLYVILGIGGKERTSEHALETARVINDIAPDFVRLRTFVPKINTPLLQDVMEKRFNMLTPHGVLKETASLLERLTISTILTSDHYTNYINLYGHLPHDKPRLLSEISQSLKRDESEFRPFFVGTQ
jgi:radical SAM superfamily enzyme YgiQ (UPF0313 family)